MWFVDFVDGLNRVTVPFELLGMVSQEAVTRPKGIRGNREKEVDHIHGLMQRWCENSPEKAAAIAVQARMEAIGGMIKAGHCEGFIERKPNGSLMIDEQVFMAAAKAPLIVISEGIMGFSPEQFKALLMEATQAEGLA